MVLQTPLQKIEVTMLMSIPEVSLSNESRAMPVIGMGTVTTRVLSCESRAMPGTDENFRLAVLQAIELGYRHFDTATFYQSEAPLGEAIAEALRVGLLKSREELFITSKLWCNDAHPDIVLPALQKSLRTLQLDYLDLYLIHFPVSCKPDAECTYPINSEDILPLDLKPVWEAMEKCQKLGLVKSIGISNFPRKKIEELLLIATIPPAVNQVEMHPLWQQKKLREFCRMKNIQVTAYSPLGGQDLTMSKNLVMQSEVLKEIAEARGKTVAQVSMRWVYEQGVSMVVKSYNKERIEANLQIFDWELSNEECHRIAEIPQSKKYPLGYIVSGEVDLKSLNIEFSDDEQ